MRIVGNRAARARKKPATPGTKGVNWHHGAGRQGSSLAVPKNLSVSRIRYVVADNNGAPIPYLNGCSRRGPISTVAVMPATKRTWSGTLSIRMRTGTRCASRTHVKIGLTVASP